MWLWDLDNLNTRIEEFRRKEYKTEAVAEVIKDLDGFYDCYNIMNANAGGIPIFRVRKIEDGEDHDNKASVWCPPSELVKEVGRANDIGEPVFYAAFDPLTSIIEGKVEIGSKFTLAIYYLKPRSRWHNTSVVINIPQNGVSQSKPQDDYSIALSEFVVDEFTQEVSEEESFRYKKSCAIAKVLFRLPSQDSIIYPSIKKADKVNIAILEDAARERVFLRSVVKCEILSLEGSEAKIKVLGYSNPPQDGEDFTYESVPDNCQTISHKTWVSKDWNFSEDFHQDRISSPEDMMRDLGIN